MEVFIGTIMPVGFNFAPRGWAFCNGQTISIAQNTALFALLGTTYGGNGQTTFGLPDLRGRVPVGSQGAGPGITSVQQGEIAGTNSVTFLATGSATVTLAAANLPAHTHGASGMGATTSVAVSTGTGGSVTPAAGSVLTGTALGSATAAAIYLPAATAPTGTATLGGVSTSLSGTTDSTGTGAALNVPVNTSATVSVMQPYLGVNFIIAIEGIFPSRN